MISLIADAINKIYSATGKMPVRIELPDAKFMVKLGDTEIWCDASTAGYFITHPSVGVYTDHLKDKK